MREREAELSRAPDGPAARRYMAAGFVQMRGVGLLAWARAETRSN